MYAIYVREYMVLKEFVTLDTSNIGLESLLGVIMREVNANFMQLQVLTVLVENIPHAIPFQYGGTFLSLFTMPIPSSLYPSKPLPSTGVLTLALWPDRWFLQGTTMPPGLMGEMYMNFGSAGVFLGMIVFGSMFGYAYSRIRRKNAEPSSIILYALLVAMMAHYIRGEAVSPTVMYAIFSLPTLFALRFVISHMPLCQGKGKKTRNDPYASELFKVF